MTTAQPVKTGKVKNRRVLSFKTIDDAIADAEQIAAAHRAGKARAIGNWTIGQNLGHVATWVNYAFDGAPMQAPWFIRLVARMFKQRLLTKGIPAGGNIPRVPGGTYGTDLLSTDEGFDRFQKAFLRFKTENPTKLSPAFGHLTLDEYIALNLRHAELHLSFIHIDG